MVDSNVLDLVAKFNAGRLSRRGLLQRATALGLTAPVLATLSGRGISETRAAAPPAQIDAKTLVIADNMKDNWITLDPGWFYEINPAAALNLVFERLYDLPDSTKPEDFTPMLAAEMPQVSADGMEVTIALRPGVKFQTTGNELTADDVIYSWNRLKGIQFQGAFLATDYWDTVEAVDALTLKITLKSPNVALVPILSALPLAITDSKAMMANGGSGVSSDAAATPGAEQADTAREWINAGNSPGTGPFMLTAWDIEGEVVLERNPDYWGEAPQLDRIIWRNIVDPNSQLQAVEAGEADLAYAVDPDSAAAVKENPALQLITGPTLAHEYIALNTTEAVGGPLANKLVRQAIGYAIDYDGIISGLMAGAAIKPASIAPEPLLATEEVRALGYVQDLERAQQLFEESGVGPTTLNFTFGSGLSAEGGLDLETLTSKLQADLQRIDGLTVTLVPMDPTTRLADYRAGKLQFTISGWSPDYPDIHTYAEPFGRTNTAAAKRVGFSNPAVDAALDRGIAEADPEKRKADYVEVLSTLIDEAPFHVLFQPIDQKAANVSVQGVATHSVFMIQLRGASKTA